MRIKSKVLLVLVSVNVAILIIVGVLLAGYTRRRAIERLSRDFYQQLSHIDLAITQFFEDVAQDLETLALDDRVTVRDDSQFTSFLDADEDTFLYDIQPTEQQIIDIFNGYRLSHAYVHSVYMGRENGSFVRSHKRARPTRYDPRDRPWYARGLEGQGQIVRTEPF